MTFEIVDDRWYRSKLIEAYADQWQLNNPNGSHTELQEAIAAHFSMETP